MKSFYFPAEKILFPANIPETDILIGKIREFPAPFLLCDQFPANRLSSVCYGVWAGTQEDSFCLPWDSALRLLQKLKTAGLNVFLLLDVSLISDWNLCFSLLEPLQPVLFCYGNHEQYSECLLMLEEWHFS